MEAFHFGYSVIQWLFFFYFYCFCGWVFESTYVSLKNRKWTNRGFMRGPFLPLYGSGAIMMLVVSAPFQDSVLLTYIAGVIGATVLEYVTGVTMEALFKVRYWDYSKQPFNFQGQICLSSSLAWGFLTIAMTRVVHKPVERLVLSVPENWLTVITILLTVYIVSDFTMAWRAAMDLKDVLVKMQKAKEELERVQKRLDVYLAFAAENNELRKQAMTEKVDSVRASAAEKMGSMKNTASEAVDSVKNRLGLEELTNSISGKFEALKNRMDKEKTSESLQNTQNTKEEIVQLQKKFSESLRWKEYNSDRERSYRRSVFGGNPTMTSTKFREVFEELKKKDKEEK